MANITYDLVLGYSLPTVGPLIAGFPVVKHDTNTVHPDCLVTLYVGGYGDLVYEDGVGNEVTIKNFSGKLEIGGRAVAVSKVKTASTCTDIVAFTL